MKILGIETSCDETAICILEAQGDVNSPSFRILGNALFSQIHLHKEFGGVFPQLAKREHAKNIVPLLTKALSEAHILTPRPTGHPFLNKEGKIRKILIREEGLYESLTEFFTAYEKPDIDMIAVTAGPGLEPALWVGISFAKVLSVLWDIPLTAANHMEGHIISPLLHISPQPPLTLRGGEHVEVVFPALALLISGGQTELVVIKRWGEYEVVGSTRDDAVGEAFDKVARLLSLPYPGGPEISKLARQARDLNLVSRFTLPRPMIHSDDLDFSFSGIKTAVLYTLQKEPEISQEIQQEMSLEFENAVTDVLISKTKIALDSFGIKTLIMGGGVIANTHIRESFKKMLAQEFSDVTLLIPDISLSTDNAVMIAAAGYINFLTGKKYQDPEHVKADGNMAL